MNIHFFGSSLVSAYWNGAATYYRGILGALARYGHKITFYEPDAFERQQHRDIPDPPWATVVVYPATESDAYRCVDAARRQADLIVKASGVGFCDALLEAAVLDTGKPAIFWDVDAPATLDRLSHNPTDPFHALIPRYQAVLTYGGGQAVVDAYTRRGARACVPIYNGVDPDTHHPVPPDPRFEADLAFLGNRLPDRESRVEEFLLRPAQMLSAKQFLLAGAGWDDKPKPPNLHYTGHCYTADHNAFNTTPLAVLNVSRDSMARYGTSPATRVFEAAGASACIITDYWEGIDQFLEPGREILVAHDAEGVVEHLNALTPVTARSIGEQARRSVLAQHTYQQRAERVHALLAQ